MTEEHMKNLRAKKEVDEETSIRWVKECVVGRITKQMLDNERMVETTSLDMMQNTSIIYHTESLLYMQTAMLVLSLVLTDWWSDELGYGLKNDSYDGPISGIVSSSVTQNTKNIIYILLGEHFISNLFGIFRDREIAAKGKPNKRGIKTAPCESRMRIFEILMDSLIFIFGVLHILSLSKKQINNLPLYNFAIIIDVIIMMFTLPYVYFS